MSLECACDCADGRCTCQRCGRSYRAPNNRIRALCHVRPLPSTKIGPGTEIKALLAKIGIVASPTCSCNKRAKIMDEKGCDWCEANLDTIVAWLREEATKRKLPFLDIAGRMLVRRAIRNARKAAS